MSGKTSTLSILVHAVVFAFLLYYVDYIPLLNQLEGFKGKIKLPSSNRSLYGLGALALVLLLLLFYRMKK